jgi:hypothetical protein
VALHPQVAQLEADLGERAQVLRVSIVTATGRKLAGELGVHEVPSFVVVDGGATERWRGTSVPTVAVVLA